MARIGSTPRWRTSPREYASGTGSIWRGTPRVAGALRQAPPCIGRCAPATKPPRAVLALPSLPSPAPAPLVVATNGSRTTRATVLARSACSACSAFSGAQAQRARTDVTGQLGTPDAGVDWRFQVPPDLVPSAARGLGTQEGTNAHLLAERMKHKGMAWRTTGARAMAKVRALVTNHTLAPWCNRRSNAAACGARAAHGFASPGPLPWPQTSFPASHGPSLIPPPPSSTASTLAPVTGTAQLETVSAWHRGSHGRRCDQPR